MKRQGKISTVIKYVLLSLGVFAFSVLISILTRRILMNDTGSFGFSESQASLIASMIEGIVGALSAGIVVYQLRSGDLVEERQSDIEEAKFILAYNQSFIQDERMFSVEQSLEKEMLCLSGGGTPESAMITDGNRQQYINYLVYLEGLAPLVLNGILQLEDIDDLMGYRFFLAMNSPALQEDQLKVFPEYYRGCFKLYKQWKQFKIDNGREILNSEHSLDRWEFYEEFASNTVIRGSLPADNGKSIADLIYGTDRYIYPAAFGSKRAARKHLKNFFDIADNPYNRENIRVAVKGGEIVGIAVVLTKPPVREYSFEDYAASHPELPEGFSDTAANYFDKLCDHFERRDSVYIACLCVSAKERGKRIGEQLLMNTVRTYRDRNIELDVLCDNAAAIRLYEKCGFTGGAPFDGYALSDKKPQCIHMIRRKDTTE